MSDNEKPRHEVNVITKSETKAKKDKRSKLEDPIGKVLPSALPSTGSPTSGKRNVTFNIYEEVHGEVEKEVELINGKSSYLNFRTFSIIIF